MRLFHNEYLLIEEEDNQIYITVYKQGFSIISFNDILKNNPRILITKFLSLKDALNTANKIKTHIGELRPLITLSISNDKMTASVRLNCTKEDFFMNRHEYVTKVLQLLHANNVCEGLLADVIQDGLTVQKDIVVATGKKPINGTPAEVVYYKLSERKPTIREDGRADYYDMHFIDEVKKGDWLGEKIPATEGTPGKTVTGEIVLPKKGMDVKFHYDRKTVGEFHENGRTVLRALTDGVVTFQGGKISVGQHLFINGDVGVETGNIEFDGSVTVNGVVSSGYSVTATKDISILGEMGISGIRKITSLNGDIFIKGGVFGQGRSFISAGGNIFVKHANECTLDAKGDIHIGYYAIGSILRARNVFTDERKGKIIGGKVEAKGKVVAYVIGNKMERNTIIQVEGFNRKSLYEELEEILLEYKKEISFIAKLRKQVESFEQNLSELNQVQKSHYEKIREELDQKMMAVDDMDRKRKSLMNLLEIKGEGQVKILKVAYPGVFIQIKTLQKRLSSPVTGTFYVKDHELQFE